MNQRKKTFQEKFWRMHCLMIFSYSLSRPLESRQRLYITEASTLAGLYVFGSFKSEITESRIVLEKEIKYRIYPSIIREQKNCNIKSFSFLCTHLTFWVGFHLSHGSSPLCGSSTGGCRIDMQRSPFWKKRNSFH